MSLRHPRTPAEWRAYIEGLSDDELWEKAVAANTASFVQAMIKEGSSSEDLEGIFVALAKRFAQAGQRPPADGWFDLNELMLKPGLSP